MSLWLSGFLCVYPFVPITVCNFVNLYIISWYVYLIFNWLSILLIFSKNKLCVLLILFTFLLLFVVYFKFEISFSPLDVIFLFFILELSGALYATIKTSLQLLFLVVVALNLTLRRALLNLISLSVLCVLFSLSFRKHSISFSISVLT